MEHLITHTSFEGLPLYSQREIQEDMLFFDIETTGLSAARDPVYCIGCGYKDGGSLTTELLFAESAAEEPQIIRAFQERLSGFPTVITFNGSTFDIPFLKKRAALLGGDLSLDPFFRRTHIDLYREARFLNRILRLPSCRQRNIEQFLGYLRRDPFTGGQLTEQYLQYLSHPDPHIREALLLHNEEDITGMFQTFGLLSYKQLLGGSFTVDTCVRTPDRDGREMLSIRLFPEYDLPANLSLTGEDFSVFVKKKEVLMSYPVRHGELKMFFDDPENYYYLPQEDYAVHKSIGAYVDPAHRRKATRKNCYSKKVCDYISVPAKTAGSPLRQSYGDHGLYLELGHAGDKDLKQFLISSFEALMSGSSVDTKSRT